MRPAASFCPEAIHLSRRQNPLYRAEVEFFDALARQMPEGWHVFYHVGWLNRDSYGALRDGESDFVLAHAMHGVLAIGEYVPGSRLLAGGKVITSRGLIKS
jgi:hypothetical protein